MKLVAVEEGQKQAYPPLRNQYHHLDQTLSNHFELLRTPECVARPLRQTQLAREMRICQQCCCYCYPLKAVFFCMYPCILYHVLAVVQCCDACLIYINQRVQYRLEAPVFCENFPFIIFLCQSRKDFR